MKSITSFDKESRLAWSPYGLTFKSLIISTLILTAIQSSLQAQEVQFTKPSWYFGVAGGANFNFYRGTTQELNSVYTTPTAFHDGSGVGLYIAPLIEFHRPDTRLGLMLQVGYDSRKGTFKEVMTPCNCPADLNTDLGYITIEPSLRLAPFKSNFYLYAGPRFAFNLTKEHSFTYSQGINPAFPTQVAAPDVTGDFSNMKKNLISGQIGMGYDIWLSPQNQTQLVLSPFIALHPYFGQEPRSIESWNVTTIRVGAALKLGNGRKIAKAEEAFIPEAIVVDPEVQFTVVAPKNIPVQNRVRETFPIRNYVFFNLGSTEIPNRYVLLRKDQVKDFREDQLEVYTPKELSGRSKRQMTVYYNVINILGDRLVKYPTANVRLVGSSRDGANDGKAMAESVKLYLVNVFAINPSRITTEGRIKPEIAAEVPGATKELVLIREGDHRVSIESNSPALLMEFQSGPDAPLRPVEIVDADEIPLDSYATFNVQGAEAAFSSWMLEIRDEEGKVQYFGPYTKEKVTLSGASILGDRPEGDYKITMVGQLKSGKVIKREATAHMVLWTPAHNLEIMRFSVIYEFNNSKAIKIYEKYLTDIVAPKIPKGGTVVIKGYTDIIGEEAYNLTLSLERANDVKAILENALTNVGRSDVRFEVSGSGEDEKLAPFDNKFPEERFYNRTVIIDIYPSK